MLNKSLLSWREAWTKILDGHDFMGFLFLIHCVSRVVYPVHLVCFVDLLLTCTFSGILLRIKSSTTSANLKASSASVGSGSKTSPG